MQVQFKSDQVAHLQRMTISEMIQEALVNSSFAMCLVLFYPRILTRSEFISHLQGLDLEDKRKIISIWLNLAPEDFKTRIVLDFLTNAYDAADITRMNIFKKKRYNYEDACNDLFNVHQLVGQMCSIESSIFEKIQARDYFIHGTRAIQENILYFNRLSAWVLSIILKEKKVRKRAKLINYFIKVGVELKKVGNFNSLFSIIASLNSSAVGRLKQTLQYVPALLKKELILLEKITSGDKNWKEYKTLLKNTIKPVIPFLGLHSRDLTVLFEYKDKLSFDEYNAQKLVKISEIVLELMDFKSDEFPRVNHAFLLNVLCQSETFTLEMAYKISKELE